MFSTFNIFNKKSIPVWSITASAVALIVLFLWLQGRSGGKYVVVPVGEGDLVEEVQASGKIEFPGKVDLYFKNSGKITSLPAKTGKKVIAGEVLAKQDTSRLDSLVNEMQSNINLQKARLNQLLAGASGEDVRVVEAQVTSATVAVASSQKSLENSVQNAGILLRDAYSKADDAIRNNVDQMFKNSQTDTPELIFTSITDSQVEGDIERTRVQIEQILKSWDVSSVLTGSPDQLALDLLVAKNKLEAVRKFLDKVAVLVNNPNNKPASIGQSTWDTWRAGVATSRASVSGALLSLSSAEETISQKESAVATAEASLKTAREQLTLKKAPTRTTDAAVYQAQIEQAKAALWKVQTERQDFILVSPVQGVVTETTGEVGETSTPGVTVVSVLADGIPEITLNIIEDSIANVRVGQSVRIKLDALPEKELYGKVASIDPAETKISGAVYYKAKIVFSAVEDFMRSGMTANVWIETDSKSDVVYVPASAVYKKGEAKFVRILKDAVIREIEVKTGIKSGDGNIEILSSTLKKGDQLVLQEK